MEIKDIEKCIASMEYRRTYLKDDIDQRYIDGYVAALNRIIEYENGTCNIKNLT